MRGLMITEFSELTSLDGDELLAAVENPSITPLLYKLAVQRLFYIGQIEFTIPGTIAVGNDQPPWFICGFPNGIEFVSAYGAAKTAPTGSALIWEVQHSDDCGSNWSSVFTHNINPGNRCPDSALTGFSVLGMSQNDVLRLDIAQVGSTVAGADLTVSIRVRPSSS